MTSCEEHRDFLQLRQLYMDIIKQYEELLVEIGVLKRDCIIAKSTGVAAGVVGTGVGTAGFIAGIAFAPVTLGGSLLLSTVLGVAGVVTAGLGGITFQGTNLVKARKTKEFLTTLEIMEKALRAAAERSEDTFMRLMRKVDLCMQQGNSQETSLAYLIYCMTKRQPWEDVEVHILAQRIKEIEWKEVRHTDIGQRCSDRVVGGVALGGANTLLKAGVGVGLVLADDVLVNATRFATTALATNVARAIASGVGVALGSIFVAMDIVDLVKDIKNPDELGKSILKVKGQYEKSLADVQNILALFFQIQNEAC